MSALGILPYLIALVLIFWFMIIRPQQRQRQQMQTLLRELSVGTEVMLSSGIFGRVTAIDDDAVHVEVAEGTAIRVIRGAIARIIPEDAGEQDAGEQDAAEQDTPEHDTPEIDAGNDAGPEEH